MNKIKLNWKEEVGEIIADVPVKDVRGTGFFRIHAVRRPNYCDRGDFLVVVEPHGKIWGLDDAEGFPRYVFGESQMKEQMELWVNKREVCIAAAR